MRGREEWERKQIKRRKEEIIYKKDENKNKRKGMYENAINKDRKMKDREKKRANM